MWRAWSIGDAVDWLVRDEYTGKVTGKFAGVVTVKADDHLIIETDGMHLWCSDFNADEFVRR